MSAGVSTRSSDRTSPASWPRLVALAIGAVTPGLAIIQASATSAGLASWAAATLSSAARIAKPRGFRYFPTRLPRWLRDRSASPRYLPERKPDARLK